MSTGGPRRGLEGERPHQGSEKKEGHPGRAPLELRGHKVILNAQADRSLYDVDGIPWGDVAED